MSGDDDGLREFVASRLPHLRRSAFLMCGDWELATELTEASLARVVAAPGAARSPTPTSTRTRN